MDLEKIFNAIFDAEETYSANMISVSINDKVEIINNGKEIAVFDIKSLTEEEVKTTMELIKEKNIFAPGGADLASLVSAKVVETDTTNYDLVF